MDRVSVVIPAYNREKTIKYCINSILNQTIKPFEIIIVDDCSKDRTVEIVRKLNNSSIKIIELEKNSGAQAARNRGIIEAKGEWIAFQDSDDEWLPNKLEIQLKKAKDDNVSFVYCECYVKKGNDTFLFNTPQYEGMSYKKLLAFPGPTFPGLLVKKECFEKTGLLDENVPSYQEWDTSIKLSKEYSMGFLKEPLYIYHLHEGETISKNLTRDVQGWEYIVNKWEDEILLNLGRIYLANHYHIIIEKYLMIKEYGLAKKYEEKLILLKYGNLNFYSIKLYFEKFEYALIKFLIKIKNKLLKGVIK